MIGHIALVFLLVSLLNCEIPERMGFYFPKVNFNQMVKKIWKVFGLFTIMLNQVVAARFVTLTLIVPIMAMTTLSFVPVMKDSPAMD